MKILNPLKMNNWPIKTFLIVILTLQLIVLILTLIKKFFFGIPFITEFFSFIYLTFIPGLLIIRILKLHDLDTIETILYSVGLSIATIMGVGFLMNLIYPLFGIKHPLSLFPVIITLAVFVLALCILCYLTGKNVSNPPYADLKDFSNPSFLFLALIPFLTIISTYIMNFFDQNIIQMVLLLLLSFLPLISLKWMPKRYYPLAIFVTSLSLLLHTTLISLFIWGQDINFEYYLSHLVLENGYWNFTMPSVVNGMLSITILSPFYTLLTGMSQEWVYKIVYPFLFSLVPLGLFKVYKDITDCKISLLACYYFISVNAFFTTLPAAARQEIAEIFLVLFIVLIFNKKMNNITKSILTIIFGFSIIVSHYGLSYMFLIILVSAFFINIIPKFKKYLQIDEKYNFNSNYLYLLIVFAFAWFMYLTSSSVFIAGVNVLSHFLNSLIEFTGTSQASNIITGQIPFLQTFERFLYLLSQFFIGVGIVSLFSKKYNLIKCKEYSLFAVPTFLILISTVILPVIASTMNTDRIFHISLIFLAPFFVIGVIVSSNFVSKNVPKGVGILNKKNALILISGFLAIFMLFNTAAVYQVLDQPKNGRFALDENIDFPIITEMDYNSIKWIDKNRDLGLPVYSSVIKINFFPSITGKNNKGVAIYYNYIGRGIIFKNNSYLFLSSYDLNNNVMAIYNMTNNKAKTVYYNTTPFEERMEVLYDNGGSRIFYINSSQNYL